MTTNYRALYEVSRARWQMGQNIWDALDELPPWDIRRPRPKPRIDHLIATIRKANAPLKDKLIALGELDARSV